MAESFLVELSNPTVAAGFTPGSVPDRCADGALKRVDGDSPVGEMS